MKQKFLSITMCTLLFMASCKNENVQNHNVTQSSNQEENIKDSSEQEFIETFNTEHLIDDISVYTIKIGNDPSASHLTASLPITPYNFVNQSERGYTQELIDAFKNDLKQIPDAYLDFNQHFEVKYHTNNHLVFLYDRSVSYGNNYGITYSASIFDLNAKKKIKASDLFESNTDFELFVSEIRDLTREQIRKRIYQDQSYTDDNEREQVLGSIEETLQEGTMPIDENYDALYFDEKGKWIVHFDKYQVASGVMGDFIIEIPSKIAQKYFKKDILDILKINPNEQENKTENKIQNEIVSDVDCSKVPCVALTFDDGPSVYTPKLLDALKQENVKATFFVLGKSALVQKNTLKRMLQEGHNIGNHSYDHKDFRKISEQEAAYQINYTDEIIENITGNKPHYFRFPYGAYTPENLKMVERPVIMWNVDPMDWKFRDVNQVVEGMSKASAQGIILAHDIHKTTVEAIPQVIKKLKEQGYYIVSLDVLFANKKLKAGQLYSTGK